MFYKGKKVLVTGGTGFVGTHLVEALLEEGALVRIPIHHRPPILSDRRVEMMPADLTIPEQCLDLMRGMDYVFHAAGAVGAAGLAPMAQFDGIIVNLILSARILQAAWQSGVKRLLLFSSSTVYPALDWPVKEEEAWDGPLHPAYLGYGGMKRYLEKLAEFVTSRSALKIAMVRPTAVYGRWDNFHPETSHVIPALILRALKREDPFVIWGTGAGTRDFLHITDLAKGSLLALEKYACCDPINIGFGEIGTIREIVEAVLEATGHKGAKIVYDATKPTTIPYRSVDTTKSRDVLGFTPAVSLREGLRDTVAWYERTILGKGQNK